MNRRRWLVRVVGVVAGLSATTWIVASSRDEGDLARPTVLGMFGEELTREIGRAYRSVNAREDDADVLTAAIERSLGHASHWRRMRSRLDEAVRAEFASQRTVIVEGWVLAVTEARQCALLSLHPRAPAI
jgi:hypothetical protein